MKKSIRLGDSVKSNKTVNIQPLLKEVKEKQEVISTKIEYVYGLLVNNEYEGFINDNSINFPFTVSGKLELITPYSSLLLMKEVNKRTNDKEKVKQLIYDYRVFAGIYENLLNPIQNKYDTHVSYSFRYKGKAYFVIVGIKRK